MRRFFIVTLSFFPWFCSSVDAVARDLTFDERVKAQAAIEQVYYSHQIGATMRFEEAVPRSVLEQKVRTYLKQSVALERLWQTPVTGEALRKELERMARQTRSPERLRELYSALGGDAFLIEECLARPVLVDRLTRNFFAFDGRIHAGTRKSAEGLRDLLLRGDVDIHAQDPRRAVAEVVRVDTGQADGRVTGRRTAPAARGGPLRLELTPDEYARWRAGVPRRPGEIGPMTEARGTPFLSESFSRKGPIELRSRPIPFRRSRGMNGGIRAQPSFMRLTPGRSPRPWSFRRLPHPRWGTAI